ncbi:MAG: phosphate ABC transporter permease family protein, partial [Hyphomonadaceae bacterium]
MDAFADLPVSLIAAAIVLTFGTWAWQTGATKALALASSGQGRLNSLPGYHGWYAVLWVVGPALALLLLHELIAPSAIRSLLSHSLPSEVLALPKERLDLFFADASKIAFGGTPSQRTPDVLAAAEGMRAISANLNIAFGVGALALSALGFFLSRSHLGRDFRARNAVEVCIKAAMMVASGIAILTTLGIVLSLLFETLRFFSNYSPIDFLFGTQWSPQ